MNSLAQLNPQRPHRPGLLRSSHPQQEPSGGWAGGSEEAEGPREDVILSRWGEGPRNTTQDVSFCSISFPSRTTGTAPEHKENEVGRCPRAPLPTGAFPVPDPRIWGAVSHPLPPPPGPAPTPDLDPRPGPHQASMDAKATKPSRQVWGRFVLFS